MKKEKEKNRSTQRKVFQSLYERMQRSDVLEPSEILLCKLVKSTPNQLDEEDADDAEVDDGILVSSSGRGKDIACRKYYFLYLSLARSLFLFSLNSQCIGELLSG